MTIPYAEVTGAYGGERVLCKISGGRLNSSRTGWTSQHQSTYADARSTSIWAHARGSFSPSRMRCAPTSRSTRARSDLASSSWWARSGG